MASSLLRRILPLGALFTLVGAAALREAQPMRYLRHPHVANDGRITFSYLGDIWVADATGANPRRVTTHAARDDDPRFSPDGQSIAFTSNRMGNNDVWIVSATGGEPRQLTWHTANDAVLYWTPDGKGIVMNSARGTHAYFSPLYVVPVDGSVPYPLPMDAGATGMIKQDGSTIAYNRVVPTYWRHGYKGNATGNIYVEDLRRKEIVQLTNVDHKQYRTATNDVYPMWGADGKIYFSSERDSIYNIWRIDADGKNAKQLTFHKSFGVQFPTMSPDGRTIIYENEFDLWTLKVPDGRPQKLSVAGDFDRVDNLVSWDSSAGRADGFAPAPTGEQVAVDFRGEIFLIPSDSALGEIKQVTRSPWRDRFQSFSPDGKYIAYVSDESKEEEIWLYDVAAGTRKKLSSHPSTKTGVKWSPTSTRLVFTGGNQLFQIDLATGRQTEIGHQPGGYTVTDFSADGNWVVYTKRDSSEHAWIVLLDLRTKRQFTVAPLGRQTEVGFNAQRYANEGNGLLTPDGRHVVFTRNTTSAAVNANLAAGAGMNQLFVVSLARLTENPEDPTVRARNAAEAAASSGGRQGGLAATPAMGELKIDVEGIAKRAVQLTNETAPVTAAFLSRDGRSVYYIASDTAGPGMFQIALDGTGRRKVTTGAFPGLVATPDRRFVFYRGGVAAGGRGGRGGGRGGAAVGNEVWRMTLANQRKERVNFTFPVRVDVRGEWEQIFHESWRSMQYRFYDEKMHGVDYAATRARFEPMLKHVADYEDVYALSNEVIGQLNASHTGVTGPPSRAVPGQYQTRFLGFEMEPAEEGRYRITHIYRDGPADKEWLNLKVGDYVLAVDDKELKAGDNYWRTLTETLNSFVPVKVATSASGAGARTVRIQTVTNLSNIKYEEFVETNRDFVEKETGGRIAYVHIRSMGQPQLQRFRDEIDKYWDRLGVIIDIRYNTGGNIDEELIDIIQRQPYNHVNQRYGARTWGRRPRTAIAGPKVMLINSRSFSDGEATPAAFRTLKLGTLVGTPTAGGAIWTGSYGLINGASIRTPGSLAITWDPTKPGNYGVNLENYGVPPDVWVINTPMDERRGNDRELKAACDEVMRMLRSGKYQFVSSDR
jgi:tricorn protease